MTLPRLILAKGALSEPRLVKQFFALATISGIFSIVATFVIDWSLTSGDGIHNVALTIVFCILCVIGYVVMVIKFHKIFGITVIMILLLLIGLLVVWVLGPIIVHSFTGNVNTIIGIIVAALILLVWYYISVRYFWTMIDKMKKQPGYISTKEHQEEVEARKGS